MGIDRSGTRDLRGMLVPDPRITTKNITAKDHATAGLRSDYTESGRFAGPSEPDQSTNLILRTSGSQSADGDIEIRTQRSGGALIEGAGFVYRDVAAGDTATQYKGTDGAAVVTDWEPLLYTTTTEGANIRPHVIRLLSGHLLASYSVTSLGVVRIRRYDPNTSDWTNVDLGPTNAGTGYITGAVTLCQLSSGRVLCFILAVEQQQIDAYYSDDDGTSWTAGGYRVLDAGVTYATITDIRVAYSPETQELLLFALWANTATSQATATQYASADLGTTFTRVLLDWEVSTGESIETLDIVPILGGGFMVVYIDEQPANDDLWRRRLGSAFDRVNTAERSEPDNAITALDDVTAWADEDGTMWLIVGDGYTGSKSRLGAMYRSLDQGDTWEDGADTQGTYSLHTGTTTTNRLTRYSAMSIGGRTALVSHWTAGTSAYDPGSTGVLWYGGHSSQTAPVAAPVPGLDLSNNDYRDVDYIAWGHQRSGTNPGGIWYPVETPTSVDWTGAGAGSEALITAGSLQITTTAGQSRDLSRTETDDSVSAVFLDFEVDIDAGDGSTSAEEIAFIVRLADGTFQYEVQVRCSSAGYRVYDVNASANVGAAVAFDLTEPGHIRLAMDDHGHVKTWHGRGGHARAFYAGTTGSGLTDGGAGAANLISWGHSGAAANVSRWTLVGYCFWPHRWSGTQTDSLAASWANPIDIHPKSYPTNGPALLHDSVSIEAISGPSWIGETQRIKTAYTRPISAVHPGVSPSPSRDWQATEDGHTYDIVWDLESEAAFADSFWESSSLGAFLSGSNLTSCKVQGSVSGASWVDLITLSASTGYSELPFHRHGRMIEPDTGTAPSGDRWSPHMMHAGDSILLDDEGENQTYRKILSNAEGGWRAGSKLARLQLDSALLDGTEAASGKATIYRRNFGGVAHNITARYRYVRLHIPAQKVVGGAYQIGTLSLGPVFVFGLQYGNTWATERASNVELETRDSGVRASRVRGVKRRGFEISWSSQPQDTTRMWDTEPSPDYVTGTTGGDPVASTVDTVYQILGMTERLDGPNTPIVYLGRIERGAGSHVYTMDPHWLYCRMTTQTTSLDHVVGSDGVSPVLRGNRVALSEEV